jgi:hypothetical protein
VHHGSTRGRPQLTPVPPPRARLSCAVTGLDNPHNTTVAMILFALLMPILAGAAYLDYRSAQSTRPQLTAWPREDASGGKC